LFLRRKLACAAANDCDKTALQGTAKLLINMGTVIFYRGEIFSRLEK
jgi:hypothetical protein